MHKFFARRVTSSGLATNARVHRPTEQKRLNETYQSEFCFVIMGKQYQISVLDLVLYNIPLYNSVLPLSKLCNLSRVIAIFIICQLWMPIVLVLP